MSMRYSFDSGHKTLSKMIFDQKSKAPEIPKETYPGLQLKRKAQLIQEETDQFIKNKKDSSLPTVSPR
jgi:hypothetical protein